MPASLANETVVNQNLPLREPPTIGEAPVENFRVSFSEPNRIVSPSLLSVSDKEAIDLCPVC
jgi:hypothetical protein